MSRLRASHLVAAAAIATVSGFEGLRQTAYRDPATRGEPWTICYGHTGNVLPGERASIAECKRLLFIDLDKEADGIEACIHVKMTDAQEVAVLSLAHNIGVAGVCKSSVARDFNAGETARACDDLLKFNRAAGIVFPGLTKRRARERELCRS